MLKPNQTSGPDSGAQKCEHGENADTCRKCKRLANAWNDLGDTLREMGREEPGW